MGDGGTRSEVDVAAVDVARFSALAVVPVNRPSVESIAGEKLMFLVNLQHALNIIRDVIVFELAAGDATPGARTAPEKIADLEDSVILAAVDILPTHCGRVKVGLVLRNANPSCHLFLRDFKFVAKFLREFASLVNFSLVGSFLVSFSLMRCLHVSLRRLLHAGIRSERQNVILGTVEASIGVSLHVSFAPWVNRPRIETVAGESLMFLVDHFDAVHIVRYVVVSQLRALNAARFSGLAAPVNVTDLEQPVILASVPVQPTDGRSVEGRFMLSNANPSRDVIHLDVVLVMQLAGQLALLVNLSNLSI